MILVSAGTPAFALRAEVSVSPTHGLPGAVILLSGNGFAADSTVSVVFGSSAETSAGTDARGEFTDYIPVPAAAPGTYVVTATDGQDRASVNFTLDSPTGNTTTTSSSTTDSKAKAVTTTVTTTATITLTTTSTTTETSVSTSTTALPAVTLTSTENYTTTEPPAAPVTATTTVTQLAAAVTVTASSSQSSETSQDTGAAQGSSPSSGGFSDTLLYFLAGVGIMVTAISVGMLAFRQRTIEDYKSEVPSRGRAT